MLGILFAWLSPTYIEINIAIFSSILSIMIMFDSIILLRIVFNTLEYREFKKKKTPTTDLYLWTINDFSNNKLLFLLLKNKSKGNPIENLKLIKNNITLACSNNLINLYLLKSYFKYSEKNDQLAKIGELMLVVLIGLITSFLNKIATTDSVIKKVINFFEISVNQEPIPILVDFLKYSTYFIIFVTLIAFFLEQFTKQKRRNQLIVEIVDICIKEKKKEIENK